MSTTMKIGLVLSGGGAVGAYEAGVVKALAECRVPISMVSGASIGALNGAILAASPNMSEAAERLEELWNHLGNNQILSVNRAVCFLLLKKLASAMNVGLDIIMNLKSSPLPGKTGTLFMKIVEQIVVKIKGFENQSVQPLLSEEPLIALMERYFDAEALANGLPLYVSLYPSKGVVEDIIDCICAELGIDNTRDSVFQHIQSLPREHQKNALLASAALPLLYSPREIQGQMYCDGGIGGWRNMQGNTPVTPLVEAGCEVVIVTHLSDGSLWERRAFPETTVIEIRPQRSLKRDLLDFSTEAVDSWYLQGYEDTILTMEHILFPLEARQHLKASDVAVQESLEISAHVDSKLKNAISRLK
ncbi:patatin-like phospholipase family protein [Escherichia coli]|uniref:patatin-like phospholipase family protein n=1 Tax=Escherichia coli TaxID=562 RepID=UPI00164F5866|nr:patatin-like phospholipase family protein [Escherichia coli]MBC6573234.1 patatin-like phospholipase family protein [Escherichia coli]